MRVHGEHWRSIFVADDGWTVTVIDQTLLPFEFEVCHLRTVEDAARAIRDMIVRGAPLIGVTAAHGVALAMRSDASDASLQSALALLGAARPTAVNLRWALGRMAEALQPLPIAQRVQHAYAEAGRIAEDDVAACAAIGRHGATIIEQLSAGAGRRPVNILTHCNAGWLACVDWGTALAPVYAAHEAGIAVHVLVDETRPRNQGGSLTAFELAGHGIPHEVIVDNAGGHLMQRGRVDLCIVGSDRVTARGDVTNKIGTYLKALAAHDNRVPFYAALPYSTIDWQIDDGVREVPIEERSSREVTHVRGRTNGGQVLEVEVVRPGSAVANPGFDVTPARLVTGIITERGIAAASRAGLQSLYPEAASRADRSTGERDDH
ncbi:MAG TPA: S-methyl-5-thioribose-1-phosphate isomerase [Steroidobacteraceae bacterium]|nr:S-methyl-5-thioribose-1-phosphate isomerase [Steroidobacteraceae bacterium]